MRSLREMKKGILKRLAASKLDRPARPVHKMTLLGRPFQLGELELAFGGNAFNSNERASADHAFEELKRDR